MSEYAKLRKCECWSCHKFTYLYDVVEGEKEANEIGGQYCRKCALKIIEEINGGAN